MISMIGTRISICLLLLCLLCLSLYPLMSPANATLELPVPRKETLVVETDVTPTVFDKANPFVPGGTQWGSGWHQIAYEWDWYINRVTGEIIYWRITGWEYYDNCTRFVIHIRNGVKWNDGEPYTADDIIFSINLKKQVSPKGIIGTYVKSVRSLDKLTVEINLTSPYPRFHEVFLESGPEGHWIVAKHVWEGKDWKTFANWPPTETGPYKLWKVYPDLNMFVWERNEEYWAKTVHGKFPGPKYVVFRRAPPADIDLADFVKGYVDAPHPFVFTYDLVKASKTLADFEIVEAPFDDPNPIYIACNTLRYPLSLPEVRWAVSYLVNREKIAAIYPHSPASRPCKYLHPQSWKIFEKYAYPDLYQKYKFEYDPEKARAIFESLGFKKGTDGIWVTPNGTRLSWTIIALPPPQPVTAALEQLTSELKKFGIDARLQYVDSATRAQIFQQGDWDISEGAAIFNKAWKSGDLYWSLVTRTSAYWKPPGKPHPGDNPGRWLAPPEFDKIVEKLAYMKPDDPEAQPLYKRAVEILLQELPSIPVVEGTFHQIFSSKYWKGWPSEKNMYAVPFVWWRTFIFTLFELTPAPAPRINYLSIWILGNVETFVGVDGKSYGPFSKGEFVSIPEENAKGLMDKGLASLVPPGLSEMAEALRSVEKSLTETANAIKDSIGGVYTLVYLSVGISMVTLVLLLVTLITLRRSRRT